MARLRSFGVMGSVSTRLVLVAVGLGAIGLPAPASGARAIREGVATVEIRYACKAPECPPPFLVIEGLPQAEQLTIDAAAEYEITDPAGLDPQEPSCRSVTPAVVRCSPLQSRISVNGQGGDDHIAVRAGVERLAQLSPGPGDDYVAVHRDSIANAYVEADKGNDRVLGGASTGYNQLFGFRGDGLYGREGRDVLRGRRGPDEISGGPGADSAFGGPGDDRLIMAGSGGDDADRVINCGPGLDVAIVNLRRDPAPVGCERIRHGRG